MGTGTLVLVSVLSAVEIIVILASIDTHYLKVFLGYKIWVDLIYGLGLMLYMGATGTISGVIIATFSAFFMTLTLTTAAMLVGTRKREVLADGKVIWIETPPTLTVSSSKEMMTKMYDKVVAKFNETFNETFNNSPNKEHRVVSVQ